MGGRVLCAVRERTKGKAGCLFGGAAYVHRDGWVEVNTEVRSIRPLLCPHLSREAAEPYSHVAVGTSFRWELGPWESKVLSRLEAAGSSAIASHCFAKLRRDNLASVSRQLRRFGRCDPAQV